MTRDQALLIARRIMDRCELDRAMHLDAIADEVMAGAAVIGEPQPSMPLGSATIAFARVYHDGKNMKFSDYLREFRKKLAE